ncbi:Uncharacterised protein [Vibrio cholerae]|nr:Uncharacterised protein [Vibrio cholerae]
MCLRFFNRVPTLYSIYISSLPTEYFRFTYHALCIWLWFNQSFLLFL